MLPFLKETAQDIIERNKDKTDKVCIVLPNKRAGLFFRKYYADLTKQVRWAPDMRTINRLIKSFIRIGEPDTLSLIFELYDVFKEVDKEFVYDFDNFYHLGEIILRDFSEIDNWLTDPDLLFRNIKNVEEIENAFSWLTDEQKEVLKKYWQSFSPDKKSEEKTKFLELWNILPKVYKKFREKLERLNLSYPGLTYRLLSEKIDKQELKTDKYEKYIFVGFNALNRAEEKLFLYLKNIDKAEFYWDTDTYYQNDRKQEAGDFLRKNFNNLSISPYDLPNNLIGKPKNIQLIGVPLEVGQAKIIPKILENYKVDTSGNETAIILASEHLLFPVLHSLPEKQEKINVTMGYPFSETSIFTLIKLYLDLQLNTLKNKNNLYRHKEVIALLRHPNIYEKTKKISENIIYKIENENLFYISSEELTHGEHNLLKLIFTPLPEENASDFLQENILNILYLLFDQSRDESDKIVRTIENEYIHKAYVLIKRFREVLAGRKNTIGLRLAIDLLLQILKNEQIAFTGEAVEGIQLMGVLESRNLDFKNVIILGMNEGSFPANGASSSFISQSVRYAFGMPLIKYKDSIFAYLFYRLIQRAENITIVYNNIVNTGTTGEISRFVQQLKYESGLKITEKQFKQDLIPASSEAISIKKDKSIMLMLEKYVAKNGHCNRRLSPSGINTYLNCSLQFYFRYIAKLYSSDEIEEDVSPASFGNILHNTLENLYTDFNKEKKTKTIEGNDFKKIKNRVDKYVEEAFKEHYGKTDDENFKFEGSHIIVKEVLKKYVNIVLNVDKKYAPFELTALEDKFSYHSEIKIQTDNGEKYIGIKGIIDRVDLKDNIYRVIDYKTGSSDKEFSNFDELFDTEKPKLKKNILQTFLYALLFKEKNKPLNINVVPCIFDVRKMTGKYFSENLFHKYARGKRREVDAQVFNELLPEFEMRLSEVFADIFDKNTDFTQTKHETKCEWCEFKNICN